MVWPGGGRTAGAVVRCIGRCIDAGQIGCRDFDRHLRKHASGDPNNLRRPALRMLAGLLQPGTKAGVWTFARWTDNLVPVGDVDSAWKKRTQSVSEDLFTRPVHQYRDVLDKSSADWEEGRAHHACTPPGAADRRHGRCLKRAAENARSRERIIGTLPRLKAAGSRCTPLRCRACRYALMKTLAGETGGWYQQVAQADELQRAFLRMFETVGKPDSVPLRNNRFVVDSSISEATVLVFSKTRCTSRRAARHQVTNTPT